MKKNEFLQKLKEDLSSLSDEERLNALKYYEEFFEDAGDDKEEEIITEFVSPEELANRIQEEIAEIDAKKAAGKNSEENENIFKEEIPEKEEIPDEIFIEIKKDENTETEEPQTKWQYQRNIYNSKYPKKNNRTLLIIVMICTFPIWFPLLMGFASAAFGIFMAVFGMAFAVAAIALAGFIMIGAGFMSVGYGITNIFIDITSALSPIGVGFVVAGVGVIMAYLFTRLSMVMFRSQFKFVGWAIRGITNRFSRQSA